MDMYYQEKLAADALKKCYDIASPRVKQYFLAEISHVLEQIAPGDTVLDLGCGFGRVLPILSEKAARVIGNAKIVEVDHLSLFCEITV